MARYRTDVLTPLSAADAFDAMARLERFVEWDPGIVRARQLDGDGPGLGAAYELVVRSAGREVPMRYEVQEFRPGRSYLAVARTSTLESFDRVSVVAATSGSGSVVTYDADLRLRGPLRLFDPLLALAFRRIGDRAAAGLRQFLDADR